MNKSIDALKLALGYVTEALEHHDSCYNRHPATEAERNMIVEDLNFIREALAHAPSEREQPAQQEPVAIGWRRRNGTLHRGCPPIGEDDGWTPLYTTPPAAPASQEEIQRLSALVRAQQITIEKLESQRQWVGLTDEDLQCFDADAVNTARYWEAKLRERNEHREKNA